ncbi:hypothetical protein [Sneathiella sp.]|uniref:hypothetical protein n=1 Tax=Sneathiella sp. TaxID=1964365 RepID=UPI00356746BD
MVSPVFFSSKIRYSALLSAALLLSSCSGSVDTGGIFSMFGAKEPLAPCPQVEVLPGAEAITIFREGKGRDLVDVRFEGLLTPVSGECQYVDDDAAVEVSLLLRIDATKGPAADSQSEEFPFFIAIAKKSGKIIAKRIFSSPIEIPEGRRRAAVQEEMEQRIPLSGTTGGDYVIITGFQLTKEQMELSMQPSSK